MFMRLLIIVVVVGLLIGGAIGLGMRMFSQAAPNTAAAQQTQVLTYTGDTGGNGQTGRFGGGTQQAASSGPQKVAVNEKTTILKPATGTIADLKTGDTITVQGQEGQDGTVQAKSIQLTATGAGQFQQGQGQGSRPTTGTIDKVEGSMLTITPRTQQFGQGGQGSQGTQGSQGNGQGRPQGGQGTQGGQGRPQGGQGTGQGGQGQNAQSGRPVFGTIESIDGKVITVTERGGSTMVKVQVDDTTTITKYEPGTQADLTTGQNVTVTGQASNDGTVLASTVIIMNTQTR